MPAPDGRPEVLVRVAPRLLSDALCAVLRQVGLHVSACPMVERRVVARPPRRFDVAVVSDALPPDAACDRVIRIDGEGEIVRSGQDPVVASGVAGLILELHRMLEHGSPRSAPPAG